MDLVGGMAADLAASAYKITDAAVVDAVNDRIGKVIAIDAMKARMHARKYPEFTDFFLDGLALIRVYAPILKMEGGSITVVVKHERLVAQPDPASRACAFGA